MHIAYDRGRRDRADFNDLLEANMDMVGPMAHTYKITIIQALDIFMCYIDRLLRAVSSRCPLLRKTELTELDDVIRRRDTRSAGK